MQEGLKSLALGLAQEHLHHTETLGKVKLLESTAWDILKKIYRKKDSPFIISRIRTMVLPTWYPAGGRWIRLKNSLTPDFVGLVPRGSSTWK